MNNLYTAAWFEMLNNNPGDLGRLVVTKIPVRNHQLNLVRKTLKRIEGTRNQRTLCNIKVIFIDSSCDII